MSAEPASLAVPLVERLFAVLHSCRAVPGHDPLVLEWFTPVRPDLEGIAVRLDRPRAMRDTSFAGRAGGGE